MHVLVTGGLGSLGMAATRELLDQGHRVRCFDLRSRFNLRHSRTLGGSVDLVWGNVCNRDHLATAVEDQDVVIHCAAILFPDSERDPKISRAVNVGGTRNLLDAMAKSPKLPALIFPSSISVWGRGRFSGEPRRVSDPLTPGSHYSHHKVECEEMIRASGVPWTTLRIGAAIEPGASGKLTPLALRTMFDVSLETRVEWVHPKDVGLAMANAASRPETRSKVWMIGGGATCRATQREFFRTALESIGVGMLPERAFGEEGFEMDWMDTAESQRILEFQRHSWDDFHAGFERSMRLQRWAVLPLRPLVRRVLLSFSPPWRSRRRKRAGRLGGEGHREEAPSRSEPPGAV